MYYNFAYISLALAIILIPFLIPIRTKSLVFRQLRNILLVLLLICTIITLTPRKAVDGAPLHKYGQSQLAFFSCDLQIARTATFCERNTNDFGRSCYCKNPNAMSTIAHCYNISHFSEINSFLDKCRNEYNAPITRLQFNESLSNYTKFAKSVDEIEDFDRSKPIEIPIKLNDSVVDTYKNAYDQFLGNYDRSVDYGAYLVIYWLIIFGMAAIGNWTKFMFPRIYEKLTDPLTNWFRKSFSLPATIGKRKANEKPFLKILDMLVPTRAETLILTTFLALSIFFTLKDIHYYEGDPVFQRKSQALLRYYAVRTSILASELTPLLILFGGRNNFLQWITRWDYATFITFHRWLSRIIFCLVSIHGVFYSLYTSNYNTLIHKRYVIWGVISTLSGAIIMIQGLLVLRRKCYEVFLILHIILALLFIGGAWYHTLDLYCLWFYYYAAAIWLFDRIIRIGRLISFGFPKAKVVLLADESLKIIVPKPKHWEAIPGGHAYIHFLILDCFWQSHPFTYTISVNPKESNIILFIKVKNGITQRLYNFLKTHPGRTTEIRVAIEGSYGEETPARKSNSAVFVAGGNGIPGIYAEIYDMAKRSPDNTKQQIQLIWVIREVKSLYWFYEELISLKNTKIKTTIYITKPNLSSCLDEFDKRFPTINEELPASFLENENEEEVESYNHFYADNLGNDAHRSKQPLLSNLTPMHHYSSISGSLEDFSEENEPSTSSIQYVIEKVKEELSYINFKEGRPSMDTLVSSVIKNSAGSSSFITCGHPIMVDDLRQAVVNNINNKEGKRIDYYEQLQVWA